MVRKRENLPGPAVQRYQVWTENDNEKSNILNEDIQNIRYVENSMNMHALNRSNCFQISIR
jgi:hypothetical protein